jgi:CheY-like chemotaxis protein
MTNHRIRVLIAGDIYANRALVRPFLQDDGYEVVAEANERTDLMPAVIGHRPDAVVVDEALLAGRRPAKALRRIRNAAPDSKLVVVTATPAAAAFAEADATLESGLSLAALTALLGRLFAERPPRAAVPAGALVGAGAAVSYPAAPSPRSSAASEPRGSVARFVASVGLPLVVVWSLIALLTTGGGVVVHRPDTTDLAAGGVVVVPMTDGPLAGARDSLDRLLHAIHNGNPVLATAHAQALMNARASAIAFGYPTDAFDADVESGLAGVVGLLSPGATGTLATVLGALFPKIQEPTATPGGGSGIILGPATGSGGGAGSIVTGGLGRGSGNGNDGQGNGGTHEGDGGSDGGFVALAPGDGKAWGQSHKESREDGGGPPPWANGNGPPPWANGHGDEGDVGSDASGEKRGNGHGHAYGHGKNGHGNR